MVALVCASSFFKSVTTNSKVKFNKYSCKYQRIKERMKLFQILMQNDMFNSSEIDDVIYYQY